MSGLVVLLFLGVMVYYVWPRPKSFFLDVTTDFLQVTTDADTQIVWDIDRALLCLPERRLPEDHPARLAADLDQACGRGFLAQRISNVELDWPADVTLMLRSGATDAIDLLIRFAPERQISIGEIPIVPETILRLPHTVITETGGLGLSGDVVLGQTAEHATLKLLREGRYETREVPFFRSNALLVDSGTLSMGDAITIEAIEQDKRLSAYAFVTLAPSQPDGVTPLRVIATSPEEDSRLRLQRARANPSYIEPTWSKRIANDPLAIGIATLLSLLATFLGVLNNLFRK
ncbi:hypothetical protein [Cognatishimia sp. MH4019]|uniref:hypothetical protein n=1 Tax=Cognatishimia sp. MH4019 TaxID=2854030 RepID=UPI001CD76401|nr:hypothetical protein [Cognatishimia sp. MH4019]